MKPGSGLHVISENSTKEAHRLIAASIGWRSPSEQIHVRLFIRASFFRETEEVAGEYAEELAAECSRPL